MCIRFDQIGIVISSVNPSLHGNRAFVVPRHIATCHSVIQSFDVVEAVFLNLRNRTIGIWGSVGPPVEPRRFLAMFACAFG